MDTPDMRLSSHESTAITLNPNGTWFDDLNDDGMTDLLMYTTPDKALLLWPNPSGEMDTTTDGIHLATMESNPMSSISTDDHSGDGIADLVIGYPGIGEVNFFEGPILDETALYTPDDSIAMDDPKFGTSLCSGDLMGDGSLSIAVATRGEGESPSRIQVFSVDDLGTPVLTIVGQARHQVGTQTQCQDVDGDGHADLLSSHQSLVAEDGGMAGTISLFHGPINHLVGGALEVAENADRVWVGDDDGSIVWLGSSMSIGDFDDDGIGDLMTSTSDALYFFGGEDWTSASWSPAD
jgi:hypothetical protein